MHLLKKLQAFNAQPNSEDGTDASLEEVQKVIAEIEGTVGANAATREFSLLPPQQVDERLEGHLAHYARVIKATFPTRREANSVKAAVLKGKFTLKEFTSETLEPVNEGAYAHENGDVGLISPQSIVNDNRLSDAIFDIRNPVAKNESDLSGPLCDASSGRGCTIYAVLARYRRGFFSPEWRDAETFSFTNGILFTEFLQKWPSLDATTWAAAIWPDDHITFQRIKWRQVLADYRST
jgi:hypothetical protein